MNMDPGWMGAGMVVYAVLVVILVAAVAYLCFALARYFRAKTPRGGPPHSPPRSPARLPAAGL